MNLKKIGQEVRREWEGIRYPGTEDLGELHLIMTVMAGDLLEQTNLNGYAYWSRIVREAAVKEFRDHGGLSPAGLDRLERGDFWSEKSEEEFPPG